MAQTIPVLDLAPLRQGVPGAQERLAAELRRTFTEVGFLFVRNHGVPDELTDRAFEAARRFHDMPLDRKLALRIDEHNIGYMPLRGGTTRMNAVDDGAAGGAKAPPKPNANEAVFYKRELPEGHPDLLANRRFRGRNKWPQDLPGFRDTVLAYCDALEGLGRSLLPLYAIALDKPADWFDPAFREPMYTLRMSHYPQAEPTAAQDEYGLAPHVDTSFMTILAQNKVPGLSIRLPDGTWIDAPAPPGALLVNGGMLLRRWTGRRFLATPHRVTNRSGQERYAIPFFMDAGYDAVMAPLPSDDPAAEREPITYPEFMLAYQRSNYDHARQQQGAAPSAAAAQHTARMRTEDGVELQGV